MLSLMDVEFTLGEAFTAIGIERSGTLKQPVSSEALLEEIRRRRTDIGGATEPTRLVAITVADAKKGIRIFAGMPVDSCSVAPAGLKQVSIPALEYVSTQHAKGPIAAAMRGLFAWMADHGLTHDQSAMTYMEEHSDCGVRVFVPVLRGGTDADEEDF